ncbi:hypothetical protein QQX98_009384 [Neonectria punicea]|uniref:Zn(2)-C6 fungal-type domain-containing protein n=1 Tax=Neonectria punicea TaxID=979145 RepID=A0ABR1GSI0_9HYPO
MARRRDRTFTVREYRGSTRDRDVGWFLASKFHLDTKTLQGLNLANFQPGARAAGSCDEAKPECLACRRIGVSCTGYSVKFAWVEDDGQIVASQGRRVLPCESTWKGIEPLPSDVVDLLIAQCDESSGVTQPMPRPYSISSWKVVSYNPFLVFTGSRLKLPQPDQEQDVSSSALHSIPSTMTNFPDLTWDEVFLFHHYVTHVAIIMMPYEHPRNPWRSQYPATALQLVSSGQKSLYSAMLAHAAFNVAHLRGIDLEMLEIGSTHYGHAIQELLSTIAKKNVDFSGTMASMMTLMFAEEQLYSGPSGSWRHHFEGAWTWLKKHSDSEPWKSTDLVCISLQSLNIIKIIGDTSKVERAPRHREAPKAAELAVVTPLVSTSEFGFTIGAPRDILDCIARITEFRNKSDTERSEGEVDELLQVILARLNMHRGRHETQYTSDTQSFVGQSEDDSASLEILDRQQQPLGAPDQIGAFINAAYIYLYRSLLNVPPLTVRPYVNKTFSHVSAYFTISNGNFSIWPAFIAAVEAYSEEDLAAARVWLDGATSFGIGSRDSMKRVVEEVWKQREVKSRASGMELGLIAVDWRSVMQDLDCDLLLV